MFRITDTISTIIILGNGFDLNLGFKTSYNDFLNSKYYNDLLVQNNFIATHLRNSHTQNNWLDVENELKTISNQYTSDGEIEFNDLKFALTKHIDEIDYSTMNKQSKAYNFIKKSLNEQTIILDFNYTKSTAIILQDLNCSKNFIESRLIKVHGTIDDNIIFGVEDKANIGTKSIFLKKSYNENFKGININRFVDSFEELYIFGHSLGETDHTYFNAFFENCVREDFSQHPVKIKLHYHGNISYKQLMLQLNSLTHQSVTTFKQNHDFEMIDTS